MSGRHRLYQIALDADAKFQRELERVYGIAKAADARYRTNYDDSALIQAHVEKRIADEGWRLAIYNFREHHVSE